LTFGSYEAYFIGTTVAQSLYWPE